MQREEERGREGWWSHLVSVHGERCDNDVTSPLHLQDGKNYDTIIKNA